MDLKQKPITSLIETQFIEDKFDLGSSGEFLPGQKAVPLEIDGLPVSESLINLIEDKIELDSSGKIMFNQEVAPLDIEILPEDEGFTVLLIRMIMMAIAFVVAISLVILIDNFISQRQVQGTTPTHAVTSVSPDYIQEPLELYKPADF